MNSYWSNIVRLVLNIQGGSTALNTPIIGWPSWGVWNDTFKRPSDGSFLLMAQSGSTQRCLNLQGGQVGSGLKPLVSWDCNAPYPNSQFHFTGVNWLAMGNRSHALMEIVASTAALEA